MSRRSVARNKLWLVALVGATLIGLLLLSLLGFARQADFVSEQREVQVVQNGIRSRISEIEGLVVPNTVWDDAVRHLDNEFDQDWAHDNIGQFFHLNGDFSFAYVLDKDGQPLYGMRDGADIAADTFEALRATTETLIDDVRAAERVRQSAPRSEQSAEEALGSPIDASEIQEIDGAVFILNATLVQPDFGTAKIIHARAPIVITARAMDATFLSQFADRYLLAGVHLHNGIADDSSDEAHAALANAAGKFVASLDWTPAKPGSAFLAKVLPWTVSILVLLLGAALVLYRSAHRAAIRLAASEERVHHLAYHDALTGIPNRAQFETVLARAVSKARLGHAQFALHCIDLDRFKDINDCYGHPVGDELLKLVAVRIADVCPSDVFCGRLGGDEFVIVQSPANRDSAEKLASQIIAAMATPFSLTVGSKHIGCSIGVALSDVEASTELEYLRHADLALYEAKARGRNRACVFAPEMDSDLKAKKVLQEDLRSAIANHELRMVYQPQVTSTGRVVGVEALVRWRHPRLGEISPAVFIPLAEQSDLILELGDFTLRRAAEDSQRWPGVRVAVNVSAIQVQSPGFADHAIQLVEQAGARPSSIELEMTEGVLLADDEQVAATLNRLRDAGFSLALDDFGTGYSSLSYLRKFPISKIKIDRSFVAALDENREAEAIVGAIISLARALQISVIAEGVETNEQWLRLSAAGCHKIQGFIASRPLEVDKVQPLIASASLETQAEALSRTARSFELKAVAS